MKKLSPVSITSMINAAPGWFVIDHKENLALPIEMWIAVTVYDSNLELYPVLAAGVLDDSGGFIVLIGDEFAHDSDDAGFAECYVDKLDPHAGDASWMTPERVRKYKNMKWEEKVRNET
jgi:hypothetical protein